MIDFLFMIFLQTKSIYAFVFLRMMLVAKQSTIQDIGVASSLLKTFQGLGFKLQTLHSSFEDEENVIQLC